MKKLTVVIPTYNRAKQLENCLKSILSHSSDTFEVLVSDNASQDDTRRVLESINDNRLFFFSHTSNIGASANLFYLLSIVTGDYVLILTDDSYLVASAIEKIFKLLENYPSVGLIMSRMAYQHIESGEIIGYRCDYPASKYFDPGNEGLTSLWMGTRVWTRLVVRRDLLILCDTSKYENFLYPTMHWLGFAIKNGGAYYSDDVMIINLTGNRNYWTYPKDFAIPSRLSTIKDLLPLSEDIVCRRKLVRKLLQEDMDWIMNSSHGLATTWLARIPEIRREPLFWVLAIRWFVYLPYRKLRQYLARALRKLGLLE